MKPLTKFVLTALGISGLLWLQDRIAASVSRGASGLASANKHDCKSVIVPTSEITPRMRRELLRERGKSVEPRTWELNLGEVKERYEAFQWARRSGSRLLQLCIARADVDDPETSPSLEFRRNTPPALSSVNVETWTWSSDPTLNPLSADTVTLNPPGVELCWGPEEKAHFAIDCVQHAIPHPTHAEAEALELLRAFVDGQVSIPEFSGARSRIMGGLGGSVPDKALMLLLMEQAWHLAPPLILEDPQERWDEELWQKERLLHYLLGEVKGVSCV